MEKINIETKTGEISAYIFENQNLGISRCLVFDICLDVVPFRYDSKLVQTEIQLSLIPVNGFKAFEDIQEKEYRFPINPEDGYIDGSIYLANVHNPADCTSIKFGGISGETIFAEFEMRFDFEHEGPAVLGKFTKRLSADLTIDRNQISQVFKDAKKLGLI